MFFEDAQALLRVVVSGVIAYAGLLVLLRVSGKRTLTKMNAFDLVVTVALGSSLATTLLSAETPIVNGIVGFAVLIGLQWLVAWASARSKVVRELVKSTPVLIGHGGRLLDDVIRRERLAPEEVRAALREQGFANVEDTDAIVLETAGEISVLRRIEGGPGSTLDGVREP